MTNEQKDLIIEHIRAARRLRRELEDCEQGTGAYLRARELRRAISAAEAEVESIISATEQ